MLPAGSRLRRSRDFARTVRAGRRAGGPSRLLVVHLDAPGATIDDDAPAAPVPQGGVVVSRAVGPSVVRSRVKRRLRHVLREPLGRLPAGTRLVVRALPDAAGATSSELAQDLDRALRRASR